jgi:uncharacterized protein
MKVLHKKTSYVLGEDVKLAVSALERMKGLMFSDKMIGDGLLLEPCNAIHNCFVRFPIDVIFLDSNLRIVKILRHFKPWRFSWIYWRATKTLELPAGKVPETIVEGDYLEVQGV